MVKVTALVSIVSCPGPPVIWKAVPRSATVKIVPKPFVLTTANPLMVVCDRSSAEPAVTKRSLLPKALNDWTPAVSRLLIRRVTLSAPAEILMKENVFAVRS